MKPQEFADFYVGRGEGGKYLGSISADDTSPDALKALNRFCLNHQGEYVFETKDFAAAVGELIYHYDGVTTWPHSYRDSTQTAWTYAYESGAVYVYQGGYLLEVIYCNGSRKQAVFPSCA